MKPIIKAWTIFLCIATVLLSAGSLWGAGGSLLPPGLIIEDDFAPGMGDSVGTVTLVQGDVVVMHTDKQRGFKVWQGLPLFKGDTVVTQTDSRVRLQLRDESLMTLGSRTRLAINESVYNHKKKSRFSFLRLSLGKVRFLVKKLANYRRSNFTVKTASAIIGVRGSDFIVLESPNQRTEVTALGKTLIEVTGAADPEKPVLVKDFQKTIVEKGKLPTAPIRVPPMEIEKLKKDFIITPEPMPSGLREKLEQKFGKGSPLGKKEFGPLKFNVLLSPEVLVDPDVFESAREIIDFLPSDIIEQIEQADLQEFFQQQQDIIKENIVDSFQELPEFPQLPQEFIEP